MGQGQYSICEASAVQKEFPNFKSAFMNLETKLISKANNDWSPRTFGGLALDSGQYGRTTILPPLFDDHNGAQMVTYRQLFTAAGDQTLMTGEVGSSTLPENFKVALMGFAFPNASQNITEIKMSIADRRFNRIDLQDMRNYDSPALIFEEGYTIDEEEAFSLSGYVEGPIPTAIGNYAGVWQRIVPIGAAYFKSYDKVGGAPGSLI